MGSFDMAAKCHDGIHTLRVQAGSAARSENTGCRPALRRMSRVRQAVRKEPLVQPIASPAGTTAEAAEGRKADIPRVPVINIFISSDARW